MLSDLKLNVSYRSDSDHLVSDFYVECMKRSNLYRRAVGYFTSYGLAFAAKGVAHLLTNGGRIQLIASPQLTDEDIRAISLGYEDRDNVIKRAVALTFADVEALITRDRLNALAWLISSGAMEVQLAIKTDKNGVPQRGIYHEKIGIFSDDAGNNVAFSGSPNETIGGLIENFESIDVYWSWDDPHGRATRKIHDFEDLWTNKTRNLTVLEFTQVTSELLESFKKGKPTFDPVEKQGGQTRQASVPKTPSLPNDIQLRDYQLKAIENWFKNNGRGTLKMATGSGKTFIALAIAAKLYQKIALQALIVVCPFRHLVTQWDREARRFGLEPLLAFESRSRWANQLSVELYNASTGATPFICVITTNSTFASDAFQSKLRHFPEKTLLVADEVHNLGAKKLKQALPSSITLRLGLSATPERWFDDSGTNALFEYFGELLEPQFTLKDALENKVLVPYRYYPLLVTLTDDEKEEYLRLSSAIARVAHIGESEEEDNPTLENLLIKRSRLIAVAANKLAALREIMRDRVTGRHMLFYCGDGTVEIEASSEVLRQIDAVSHVLGYELGLKISTYTADTELEEREHLRERFDSGALQGLVAIRCLDEGVDIPAIQSAVILASSTNPRQFIQRRGRILRRSPNKSEAEILDMIVVPPTEETVSEVERSLVRKEILRFVEFADLATNSGEARKTILEIQQRFGLLDM